MARQPNGQILLSVVVPMYNEEEVVDAFFERIVPILEGVSPNYEIICVDDGSRDGTFEALHDRHLMNPRIKAIRLSRNFGKEMALTAGLDYARGQAVIPIDADLQDPPELIPEMVSKWREGYDVVLARRADRSTDSVAKRMTANLFYRLIGRLSKIQVPANVGDFRLMDQRVVEALAWFPERTRFMKGIFAWLGFRQVTVDYVREPRAAGAFKLRFKSLFDLALEGLTSFSDLPLKIWSYVGFACALLATAYGAFIVLRTLIYGVDVPGYASLITVMLFTNGLVLLGLGVIGEYLSRVFTEVKGRPLYLIQDHLGALAPPRPSDALRNVNHVSPVARGTLEAASERLRQVSDAYRDGNARESAHEGEG